MRKNVGRLSEEKSGLVRQGKCGKVNGEGLVGTRKMRKGVWGGACWDKENAERCMGRGLLGQGKARRDSSGKVASGKQCERDCWGKSVMEGVN